LPIRIFPEILIAIRCAIIALFEAGKSKLDFGMELIPWSTDRFVRMYLPFVLVIGVAAYQKKGHIRWVALSSAIFFVLSALNPRGIEYAVPLGG